MSGVCVERVAGCRWAVRARLTLSRRNGRLHGHSRPHPQRAAAARAGRGEPAGDGQVPLRGPGQGEPPGDTTPTARSRAGGIDRAEIRSGAGEGSWLQCLLAVPGAARGNGEGGQEEPAGCGTPRDTPHPPAAPEVVLLNKAF